MHLCNQVATFKKKGKKLPFFTLGFAAAVDFNFKLAKTLFLSANSKPNWYNNNNKRKGGN